jgi:drug/metabolite transporter (DMT)-like permease
MDFEKGAHLLKNFNPKNSIQSKDKLGYFYVSLSSILFGLSFFLTKLAVQAIGPSFSPNSFLLWRSLILIVMSYFMMKKNNVKFISILDIDKKLWFQLRTTGNYFGFITNVFCMMYLRSSTAACFNSAKSIFTLILSIIILKERFHLRYLVGLIICLAGSLMIVMNEKKQSINLSQEEGLLKSSTTNKINYNLLLGTIYGTIHMLVVSLNSISNKVMIKNDIPFEILTLWTGITNVICAGIFSIFGFRLGVSLKYIWYSGISSFIVYFGFYYINKGLSLIDVSKSVPFSSLTIITVFVMGGLFLGEQIFITDILGSFLIMSFNIYHSMKPLK